MKIGSKRAAGRRPRGGRSAAFRAGPDFFRLAVESLSEYALITTDTDLTINSWSKPAARMFGYSEKEILGRGISLLFTKEDIEHGVDRSEFEKALDRGREDDERWHVRKDGRRLWCYGLSFPLKDERGRVRGFVKLIRDETERKAKDDKLRESEERLRLAAESTGLGTWDYDVEKRVLHLSERAADLFGLNGQRLAAGFEQFAERVHSEDRARVTEAFEGCVAAGGSCETELEYRVVMRDERIRWVRTLARAFFDGERGREAPRRLLGTVVDVTDQRKRQADADDLNRELELRVKERTAGLDAINKELESFAYSASHDLRAPLRKIAAFSQAILRSGKSRLSPEDAARFERIREATSKMHRLIDDMLVLARVSRKPMERRECDLGRLARDIAAELRARDPRRRVDFVIGSTAPVTGDCELLVIALRNLLDNAWKFTGRKPAARIEFGEMLSGGRRVFFVKDDGAGFDMRFAHKLFGDFRRLHAEDEFPGTGIGLGVTERVVRRHGGRIWAEAKVDEGAAFFFTLGESP